MSKKLLAVGIVVFNFELSIGDRCDLFPSSLKEETILQHRFLLLCRKRRTYGPRLFEYLCFVATVSTICLNPNVVCVTVS